MKPPVEAIDNGEEALNSVSNIIAGLKEDGIEPRILLGKLEHVQGLLTSLLEEQKKSKEPNDVPIISISTPEIGEVGADVAEWLSSTFSKSQKRIKKQTESPSLKSVANAIRTGLFIERIYSGLSSSHMLIISEEIQEQLKDIDNWNFDIFTYSRITNGSPLKFMSYHILSQYGLINKLKIPPGTLDVLLGHLEVGYAWYGNPYHNNLHAADVLQNCHWIISQTGLKDWMSDLEIFSLLFSAIIHDYNHTGTTNNFHIQSTSDLAVVYNDRSVLENHHVAAFFRTMFDNECNILSNLAKHDYQQVRTMLIETVLGTDMSLHFTQLQSIQSAITNKTKVMSFVLHSADVAHPTKAWDLHKEWTARCMEEFFNQGDREKEMGLDVSPLCDRNTTQTPQSQLGYINFIIGPQFDALNDVLNKILNTDMALEDTVWFQALNKNKSRWREKADSCETTLEPSGASKDIRPPLVFKRHKGSQPSNGDTEETEQINGINGNESGVGVSDNKSSPKISLQTYIVRLNSLDNRHLIKQIGPIIMDSTPPRRPTRHRDMISEVPPTVISRPGSPTIWNFGLKDSIGATPPRPGTSWGACLSPPQPRRAPISVDHTLRKHALDFS